MMEAMFAAVTIKSRACHVPPTSTFLRVSLHTVPTYIYTLACINVNVNDILMYGCPIYPHQVGGASVMQECQRPSSVLILLIANIYKYMLLIEYDCSNKYTGT